MVDLTNARCVSLNWRGGGLTSAEYAYVSKRKGRADLVARVVTKLQYCVKLQ